MSLSDEDDWNTIWKIENALPDELLNAKTDEEFESEWAKYIAQERAYYNGYSSKNETYSACKPYKPYKPYAGIDRKKWPNTFQQLVLFYYSPEWHSMTKYVNKGEDNG